MDREIELIKEDLSNINQLKNKLSAEMLYNKLKLTKEKLYKEKTSFFSNNKSANYYVIIIKKFRGLKLRDEILNYIANYNKIMTKIAAYNGIRELLIQQLSPHQKEIFSKLDFNKSKSSTELDMVVNDAILYISNKLKVKVVNPVEIKNFITSETLNQNEKQ